MSPPPPFFPFSFSFAFFFSFFEKKCFNIRSVLLDQTKLLLNVMHDRNKSTLERVLDREKWKQIDVTVRTQLKLYHIQNNSHDTTSTSSRNTSSSTTSASSARHAVFNDKQYFVVGAMSTLINLIDEYLQCSRQFPSLSHQILPKLIEILKIFNTETKRLILKAEARESTAKLSSITIKHLAVASQCIELTSSLIPSLRLSLASYMQPKFHSLLHGKIFLSMFYFFFVPSCSFLCLI